MIYKLYYIIFCFKVLYYVVLFICIFIDVYMIILN